MSVDRDRILEQALKHELRGSDAPTPSCLDAETIAAWHDGGLDPAQLSAAELHASTCPRCQAMLAAFARATTPPVVREAVSQPDPFRWGRWWLAPIAAGAAAVTLWMVVPEQQQIATAPPARPQATAPIDATQSQARAKSAEAPPAAAPQGFADARKRDADEKSAVDAPREDRQQLKDNVAAALKEEKALEQSAPQALPPPAAPALPTPPPAATFATGAVAAPAGARSEALTPGPPAALQKSARMAVAPIEIATLDPSLGWRIVGDQIQSSTDGGKVWAVLRQNSSDGIVAGSAPTNAVCWFVGRGGRVLLTTDAGATFAEVSLNVPLDLASVAATDARSAMIFSVIGRRFRTNDGGLTWREF